MLNFIGYTVAIIFAAVVAWQLGHMIWLAYKSFFEFDENGKNTLSGDKNEKTCDEAKSDN